MTTKQYPLLRTLNFFYRVLPFTPLFRILANSYLEKIQRQPFFYLRTEERGIKIVTPTFFITLFNSIAFRTSNPELMQLEGLKLKDGDIVDIGGNIGFISNQLLKLFPNRFLHLIEPDTFLRTIAGKNLELNGVIGNCKLYKHALSESKSRFYMNIGNSDNVVKAESDGRSVLTAVEELELAADPSKIFGEIQYQIEVESSNYEELFTQTRIALIKIDIEGYENDFIKIISKLKLVQKPHLFIEFHPTILGMSVLNERINDLKKMGYEISFFDVRDKRQRGLGYRILEKYGLNKLHLIPNSDVMTYAKDSPQIFALAKPI